MGIVLLCRGCGHTEGSTHNESIYGSFAISDRSCVYTFREDGSGELRLSGAPYRFRFALSGRTLSIDFEAEALTDCEYEVAYTDTGLELTAGKGTATQGEKFTLNRTENDRCFLFYSELRGVRCNYQINYTHIKQHRGVNTQSAE